MAVYYKLLKTYGSLPKNAEYKIVTVENETVGIKRISRHIQQATSLTTSDIIGAIAALKEEIAEELKMGNNVHLPGIGYFSLAVKGNLYKDPRNQRYRLRNAAVRTVKFRPDNEMLKNLHNIEFENVTYTHGTHTIPTPEAVDKALDELFADNIVITVSDLRQHLRLSRSYAYILANRLTEEGKLREVGRRYRKLYERGK